MIFNPSLKLARHRKFARYMDGEYVAPVNVELSPTGICDAACSWCFYADKKDRESLTANVAIQLLKDMETMGVEAVSWTGGGEPTLWPHFPEVTRYAHELGLKQGLFTNGLGEIKYDPKLFDWIRVSKTTKYWNLDNLKELRKRAGIVGLAVNFDGNTGEARHAYRVANELGLDYIQVRPTLNLEGKMTFIEAPNVLGEGVEGDTQLIISDYKFSEARKRHSYSVCEGYHFVPFVWQNGDVTTCGYMRDPRYVLGNLYKDRFYKIMREAPSGVNVDASCQVCCKNHEVNKTIAEARKLEDLSFV